MHCIQCGAEVPEGAKFCAKCGNPIGAADGPQNPPTITPVPNGKPAWKGGAMFWLIVLSVFVPIVGLIVAIVAVASKGSNRKKQGIALLIISTVFLIVGIAVVAGSSSKSGSSASSGSAAATGENQNAENTPKATIVDYHKLYNDYEANAIKADATYRGKLLQLTGPVDKIDREVMGQPYVTFAIDEYFKDVRITFRSSEESKVAALSKGQTITIIGTCQGTLLSTTVAMDDCILVK